MYMQWLDSWRKVKQSHGAFAAWNLQPFHCGSSEAVTLCGSFPNKIVFNSVVQIEGLSTVVEQQSAANGMSTLWWNKGEHGRRAGKANSWIQLGSSAYLLLWAHSLCLTTNLIKRQLCDGSFGNSSRKGQSGGRKVGRVRFRGHSWTNSHNCKVHKWHLMDTWLEWRTTLPDLGLSRSTPTQGHSYRGRF